MARYTAELVMVLLGVTSAVLLVAYGLLANGGSATTDPLFWLFVIAFLVYIVWDIRRHFKTMRLRPQKPSSVPGGSEPHGEAPGETPEITPPPPGGT